MNSLFLRHTRVTSKEELKKQILKGIAEINEAPVPFRWKNATHDQTIKDHGWGTAGEKDLVPELSLAPLLDYYVSVILKEGNNLYRDGNLLPFDNPPVCLTDDLVKDADCTL